jgi:hypothetical protein
MTKAQMDAAKIKRRVVEDLRSEMKILADKAINVLVATLDSEDATVSERLAAAREVLDRGFGKPHQMVTADINVNEGCLHVTPQMLRQAALRIAASSADDAEVNE